MVQRVEHPPPSIRDIEAAAAMAMSYDLAVWAAGFEARSRWLVSSPYRPQQVSKWFRVEYAQDRGIFSAPQNLQIDLGALLGNTQGEPGWDGHWTVVWRNLFREQRRQFGRRLNI